MKLLERMHIAHPNQRPAADAAETGPQPQPERSEPVLPDPGPANLSVQDYLAVLVRALKRAREDNLTTIAAALAYYAFLAIPSVLMMAVGSFGLAGDPREADSLVRRLSGIIPNEAQSLLSGSLETLTRSKGTGITVLLIGTALALWSLTGAMQNVMWGLNVAYERREKRGIVRRRLIALAMVGFAVVGVLLVFGLLVLGPHLTRWVGDAIDQRQLVSRVWWIAEWPVLLLGLSIAAGGIYYLGPDVEPPRWRFLGFGTLLGILFWLGFSGAFAFYASRFGSYNKSWGSLSAVVVMLTWLWLSSLALLVGGEINAEAERSRELRRGEPAEVVLQAPAKT
jgi:membrane protein